MKHILLLIGVALFAPVSALAACPEGKSADYLGVTPTSGPNGYVQMVLDRTDNPIATAASAAGGTFDSIISKHWLQHFRSFVYEAADAEYQLLEHGRDLRANTTCLNVDLKIIESQIEKARCEMENAYDNFAYFGIWKLGTIIRFLNERHYHLTQGARDPTYVDPSWHVTRFFETTSPNTFCCLAETDDSEQCPALSLTGCTDQGGVPFSSKTTCLNSRLGCDSTDAMPTVDDRVCPFHSNYLPPTAYGYGCSQPVLDNVSLSISPFAEEKQGMDELMTKRDEFIDEMVALTPLFEQINQSFAEPPTDLSRLGMGRSDQIPVQEISGCLETIPGFDPSGITGTNKINAIYEKGGTRWSMRGKFALHVNEFLLMRGLMELFAEWGALREQADFLKQVAEVEDPATFDPQMFEAIQNYGFLERTARDALRIAMRSFNVQQAINESEVIVKATDNQKRLDAATRETRDRIKKLGELTSQNGVGVRRFTVGMAYYLARTCSFRPCSEKLKRVLKITLEDTCFPYVNGQYIGNDTIWEDCESAADL